MQSLMAWLSLAAVPFTSPAPAGRLARFNEVYRIATHNSYWIHRDPVVDLFATGTQLPIVDQLAFEGARAIELDIHKGAPGQWTISHTSRPKNSFCNPLASCLEQLRLFHRANPGHSPVTVMIELKEIIGRNFDASHTPAQLDAILEAKLGPNLYRPRDFLRRCAPGSTLRECAREAGWPSAKGLRGKFIVTVLGNWRWCRVGHGFSGWAEYASWGGGAAERSAFPMNSDWGDFSRETCGAEYIPADKWKAALDASIFLQVENVGDASHLAEVHQLMREGVIVRGANSFSLAEQEARLAEGFSFLQTDYPWLRAGGLAPETPLLPHHPELFDDLSQFVEPGERLRLGAGQWRGFEADRAYSELSALVSSTRASPDAKYPNASAPAGMGCLEAGASSDPGTSRYLRVCREVEQRYQRSMVRVSWRDDYENERSVEFPEAGPWLRVSSYVGEHDRSCAAAYAAAELGADGAPAWRLLSARCFDGPLPYVGRRAFGGDVVFTGGVMVPAVQP